MAKKRNFLARVPLAPVFAVLFGGAAATLVAATPQWLFEQWVASTGLASVVSVAVPPLGIKARLLAVFLAFALVAGLIWGVSALVERLIAGPRPKPEIDAEDDDDILDLGGFTQTDADPAPRRPIFADRELGAPLMSDEALNTAWRAEPVEHQPFEPVTPPVVPHVLDLVEPESEAAPEFAPMPAPPVIETPEPVDVVHAVPFEPVVEAPELAAPLAVDEFELPAAAADEPEQLPGESTIDALIRRLEAGLAKRGGPNDPDPAAPVAAPIAPRPGDWLVQRSNDDSLDDDTTRALATLRRMAG